MLPQVGSEVARRAKGLGCKVIAYDPYASAEMAKALGVTLLPLDECLAVREQGYSNGGALGLAIHVKDSRWVLSGSGLSVVTHL